MSLCSYMEKGSEAESTTVQIFPKTRINESVSAAVVIQHLPSGNLGWGDGKEDQQGKGNDYVLFLRVSTFPASQNYINRCHAQL